MAKRYKLLILSLCFAAIFVFALSTTPDIRIAFTGAILLIAAVWGVAALPAKIARLPFNEKLGSEIIRLLKSGLTVIGNTLLRMFPLSPKQTLILRFQSEGAVFFTDLHLPLAQVTIQKPGDENLRPKPALVAVMPGYAAIYPRDSFKREAITFNRHNIRWMGRIQKVGPGASELSLDVVINYRWYTITIKIDSGRMQKLEEALVNLLPEDLATVRNRRRPNLREQPREAYPLQRTLRKLIEAGQPVQLYATPLWLVILRNGVIVAEIALDDIEAVSTTSSGNVRFAVQGESWSFEMPEAAAFAQHLARITG